MHNLHIVVTRAASAEEAMSAVEDAVAGWGNENNWYSITGAVGEDGTYHPGEARSHYSAVYTLEELNKLLMDAVQLKPDERVKRAIAKLASGDYDGLAAGSVVDAHGRLFALRDFADQLDAVYAADLLGKGAAARRKGPLSVFDTKFRPWEYAEFGVTHIENDVEEEGMRYAVLVDMHS